MQTYLDASIKPAGYIAWSATDPRVNNYTFMAVFDDYGPGWTPDAMAASNVTIVLDERGVQPYRDPADVFITEDGRPRDISWIDLNALR